MNQESFNWWWIRNLKDLKGLTKKILLRYLSNQEEDEVLQITYVLMLLRVLDQSKPLLEVGQIKGYLFRVIRNVVVTNHRREKREGGIRRDYGRQMDPPTQSDDEAHFRPFEQFEKRHAEFVRRLETCLKGVKLTAKEAEAVYYWADSKMHRRTALERMALSEEDFNTAQRRYDQPLYRAKRKIRQACVPLQELVAELGVKNIMLFVARRILEELGLGGVEWCEDSGQKMEYELKTLCC